MATKYLASAIGAIRVLIDDVEVDNVTSVTIPDLAVTMAEVKGAGILGTVRVPVPGQMEAMTVTIEVRRSGKQRGALMAGGDRRLEVRIGENVRTARGDLAVEGTKIFASGYFAKVTGGKAEAGSPRGEQLEYSVYRYREVVDGEEVTLIDQLNPKYKVNGRDEMSGIMAVL